MDAFIQLEPLLWSGKSAQVSFQELHGIVHRLVMEKRAPEVEHCIVGIVTQRCKELVHKIYAPICSAVSSDTFGKIPMHCLLPYISLSDMVSLSKLTCMLSMRRLFVEKNLQEIVHGALSKFLIYLHLIESVCMSYDTYYAAHIGSAQNSIRKVCLFASMPDLALLDPQQSFLFYTHIGREVANEGAT